MLMLAHNFPQTTPDTIANHRVSEMTSSDEPNTTRAGILDHAYAEREQFTAPHQAVSFDALKFRRVRQAASFWERK
jgi:hypothetical protein